MWPALAAWGWAVALLAAAVAAARVARFLVAAIRQQILLSRLPMAPDAHFFTGHLRQMSDPRHHVTLLRWTEQVGPLFCIRLLWMKTLVVADPALVHRLLRGRVAGMDKSTATYEVVDPMGSPHGLPSLFSASTHSPYWKLVRKGTAPAFSTRCLRGGFRHIQATCGELVAQLRRLGPDTAFDVDNLLMRATLDVIGRVAFESDFGTVAAFGAGGRGAGAGAGGADGAERAPEQQEIFTLMRRSLDELNRQWANPLRARWLGWLPEVRHAMRYWRALQRHMQSVLREIRARGPPPDDDESIAAHLLRLRDPHTGQPLSDDRLLPEISTFFIAGTDTTAHTMAWTLLMLARHPEAERRVCRELDGLGLLATPERPEPRMVEVEDLGKLSYLSAVVKESMRLLPVSADGTAVQCPRDIQLGGHTVPADTIIWVHIYSVHNSPRYWERPREFLPERFQQPGAEYVPAACGGGGDEVAEAAAAAAPDSPRDSSAGLDATPASPSRAVGAAGGPPLRFFPFSQGARDCIGQQLARMDYLAMLAALLGRFAFRLAPEAAAPGGVQDVISLTLQPENGLWVTAVPRA